MTMTDGPEAAMKIRDWDVDPSSGTMTRAGESVRLEPKVMAVLLDLASHQGAVRPKEAIISAVWSDSFVGEAALSRCISELRRALGDDARRPLYIETLPKRGYRLVAEVSAPTVGGSGADIDPAGAPIRRLILVAMAVGLVLATSWWAWRWQPGGSSNGSAPPPPTLANPEALRAYEGGRILSARGNPADALRGLEYYRQALELEPDSALVHAALADAQATLAWNNWTSPASAYGEARVQAYRALDLDPRLPEGHTVLAAVAAEANWDWPEAERGFRTAIDLDPGSAFAHERFSRYLRRLGRLQEALAQTSQALTSEPDSLTLQASHGWNLLLAGRLDEATALYQRILELDDNLSAAYVGLCAAHNLRRESPAAIGACERAAALPGHELQRGALGYAYALAGNVPRARQLLAELQAANGTGEMAALAIATIDLGLGDRQSALDGLERALAERVIYVAAVLEDPYLRQLREEPRFQALLEALLIPRGGDD